jgi:allantoin racemase
MRGFEMKILVINPNTSEEFNRKLDKTAKEYALPSTEVKVISPKSGPKSIEGIYDEALSVRGTIEVFIDHEKEFDGFIVACYSDPLVVYAMREITQKPVLGMAEASIHLACMLGTKFSIVTTNERWVPLLHEAVKKYGVESRCASVRTTGLRVLDLESEGEGAVEKAIEREALVAVKEDGAEVICLGCAGMSGFDKTLERKIGVPILDGFICALKLLELFQQYGLRHSKVLTYAAPLSKELTGLSSQFSNVYLKNK